MCSGFPKSLGNRLGAVLGGAPGSMLGRPGALCGFTVPQEAAGEKVRCLPEATSFLEEVYETEAECLPENVEGVDAPWKMTPRVMALTCMRWALVAVHQARAGKNGTTLLVL